MRKTILGALALMATTVAANATPITGNYTVTSSGSAIITDKLADPFTLNLVLNTAQTFSFVNILEQAAADTTITAKFTFTSPTGSLNDVGADSFTITGNGSGNHDSLTWTTNLNAITLGDGSILDLTLSNESYNGNSSNYTGLTPTVTFNLVKAGTVTPTSVPEPLTLSLFGAGLAGAAAVRRRRKARQA
jgi:hypothetical protein